MNNFPFTATACVAAFSSGEVSAQEIASASLARIARANPGLNAFIEITSERALAEATAELGLQGKIIDFASYLHEGA